MGGGQVLASSPEFSGWVWDSDQEEEEVSDVICSLSEAEDELDELDDLLSNDISLSESEGHQREAQDGLAKDEALSEQKEEALVSNDGALSECGGRKEEEDDDDQRFSLPSVTSKPVSAQAALRQRMRANYETIPTREIYRRKRSRLNRYTPGKTMMVGTGGKGSLYAVPDVTSLLVVGYKGAGKSTLINNVIEVLNNKSTGLYRAQVADDPTENGTHFIGEYLILGNSGQPRVSLFDTRGLSEDDSTETLDLLRGWMMDGVHHGQVDLRASDSDSMREALETRGRHSEQHLGHKRNVNFVIFVIDAVSALQMKDLGDANEQANLLRLYKNPHLTFKDDRPVVVLTHGDKLSYGDRISARMYIGEILGIAPLEQVFDISGPSSLADSKNGSECDTIRDLAVLDMLTFALECADRNLPPKRSPIASLKGVFHSVSNEYAALDRDRKAALIGMIVCIYILFILCISACVSLSFLFKRMHRHHKGHWW